MRHADSRKRQSKRIRPLWVGIAVCFVIGAIFAAVIVVWGIESKDTELTQKNPGVTALYEFIRSCEQNEKKVQKSLSAALCERLLDEPFETDIYIDLTADGLSVLGMPLSRIMAGVDTKYDLTDLGMKAHVMGFPIAGAYLIGQNFVLDIGEGVQAYGLDGLPEGPMPLRERLGAVLPYLPDTDLSRVVNAVAYAVPAACSEELTVDFYSPMDGKTIQTQAVYTQLDAPLIRQTAESLAALIEADSALHRDMQTVYSSLSLMHGTADENVVSALQAFADSAPETVILEWTVYRFNGQYAGCRFGIENGDETLEWTVSVQFGRSTKFGYWSVLINGKNVFEAEYGIDYQQGTIDGDVKVQEFNLNFSGIFDVQQPTYDAYTVKYLLTINGDAFGMALNNASCDMDMNIRFGESGSLRQARRWKDIFDKEWKETRLGRLFFDAYGDG